MSCTEFEAKVTDLADDRLMDAVTRRRLQQHADQCSLCAARLDGERRLSERLDALAHQTEDASANPALKAELLAAFDKLHAPQQDFAVHTTSRRALPYWQLAAAAALILALLSAALFTRSSSIPRELAMVEATPLVSPSPVASPSPTPALDKTAAESIRTEVARTRPTRTSRTRTSAVQNDGTEIAALTQETTTDYLPLTYFSDQTALQTGVVVRVEIPRATLLSMGLPMNTDRGNTLVKADVVVGDDGVPRAIRLVQ